MSDEGCGDGDEGACISGLAAISEADEIYVYDPPNNNLKVFSPAGTRVIVGPENLGVAANLVADVAVASGTVVLLVEGPCPRP